MSSLHKLKAYFGMVPVDEYDGYDDYDEPERPVRHRPARAERTGEQAELGHEREVGHTSERELAYVGSPEVSSRLEPLAPRGAGRRPGAPVTRGALAVDDRAEHRPLEQRAPERRAHPFAEDGHPLGKITTLNPRTYNEARTIGERYREGNPVIMNLTDMSDPDAKRLVDFAAGLAFAMRGAIDKVTNKVFLLSPPNVDVSAEDKRRIVENGFYHQS